MASWLVLDWDQDQFHVLCAESSRRGIQVTRAVTWSHPEPFTPSTAARVGAALRDFLKSAKIAAAPVIVGIGRDRIFLKELRFPPIAAHEEASLVRFQTGKEMAEAVDSYAIDYVHLKNGSAERQVMTVAARRDFIAMVQNLCQSAGLKLHAVTPKLFGMPLALDRAIRPEPPPLGPKQLNVVLNVGQRWAELCFFRGDRLLQSQALANGPLLASEVKRSLAVFQAQSAVNIDLQGPDCLYVFGDDEACIASLQAGQHLPVRLLDPLKPEAGVADRPVHFAGAAGLAALWSHGDEKAVNLASPKRAQAPPSAIQQRGVVYGSAAGVAALFLIAIMAYVLSVKRGEIDRLTKEKLSYDKQLTELAQERAEVDAYREWENTTIPWLDEMYDLTARYPYEIGLRVNQFQAQPNTGVKQKGVRGGTVAKMTLNGIAPTSKDAQVDKLVERLLADPHLKADRGQTTLDKTWVTYQLKIDVAKQALEKYEARLVVPPRPPAPKVIETPPDDKKDDKKKEDPTPPDDDKKKDDPNPDDGGAR